MGTAALPASISTSPGESVMDKKKPRLVDIEDIWPQERDYMERPERLRYVRKLVPEEGCVFCKASKAGVGFDSLCLFADDEIMILLNKFPYNTAHAMVLPREHIGNLLELDQKVYTKVNDGVRKLTKVLQDVYEPSGFNIGLNHGRVAGAGIPDHLHWHVIPRWLGDTNFFPLIAETKVLPETLEQTYDKLKGHF